MLDCIPFSVISTVRGVRCHVGDRGGAGSGSVCVPIEQLCFVYDRAGPGYQWKKQLLQDKQKKKAKLQRARETQWSLSLARLLVVESS